MGSPIEEHQDVHGLYSNEYYFLMPTVPQSSTSARNTDQVNSTYSQIVPPDSLNYDQHWLSDTRNDSNPYPGGAQIFDDVSSHVI